MTGDGEQRRIIVGIDGSETSDQALLWSTTEAAATRRPLHLLHCVVPAPAEHPSRRTGEPTSLSRKRTPRRVLADAEASVRLAAPSVRVRTELAYGVPATALLDRAGPEDLVVVGSRGLGRLTGFLAGSVSATIVANASCPVVVVRRRRGGFLGTRGPGRSRPRVVVGIDGSRDSAWVVDFAFAAAASRAAALTAVLAWSAPFAAHPAAMPPMSAVADGAARRLAAAVQDGRGRFPDVEVRPRLLRATARAALLAESEDADLLVVGTRGHGTLGGLLLGSVSQALLRRPGCPIAVVKTTDYRDAAPSLAA